MQLTVGAPWTAAAPPAAEAQCWAVKGIEVAMVIARAARAVRGVAECAVVVMTLGLAPVTAASERAPALRLLPGYSLRMQQGTDSDIWDIVSGGERRFRLEVGLNAGSWAHPKNKASYSWYRELLVRGHRVRLALTKPDVKGWWDSYFPSREPPGSMLLVTFQLEQAGWDATANFAGRATTAEALADGLVMALTFDPSAGGS